MEVLSVINHINAAIANKLLYSSNHPQVADNIKRAFKALKEILNQRSELKFIFLEDKTILDNKIIVSKTPHLKQFSKTMRSAAVDSICFLPSLTINELKKIIEDLASVEKDVLHSSSGIILGKIDIGKDENDASSPIDSENSIIENYKKIKKKGMLDGVGLTEMKGILKSIKSKQKFSVNDLKQVIQSFISGMLVNIKPLEMLASLKDSDEYTFTHAINVCILTMMQAESLGVQGKKLYEVGLAAAMHDVGKMFIPDEILNKTGKLTGDERSLLCDHALRGAQYILKVKGMPKLVFIAALEHHICYNGKRGYPILNKKNTWKPHIVSQMIAVSDVFDAMRSRRPYQAPQSEDSIIEVLLNKRGSVYNPFLVDNFLHLIQPKRFARPDPGNI
ncbi:MAG: HD domain-containing protein [Desulfobacteraceae bacterium]|nr:HD domain-containing protein [Desulfobacteraceae bacterium]